MYDTIQPASQQLPSSRHLPTYCTLLHNHTFILSHLLTITHASHTSLFSTTSSHHLSTISEQHVSTLVGSLSKLASVYLFWLAFTHCWSQLHFLPWLPLMIQGCGRPLASLHKKPPKFSSHPNTNNSRATPWIFWCALRSFEKPSSVFTFFRPSILESIDTSCVSSKYLQAVDHYSLCKNKIIFLMLFSGFKLNKKNSF